MGEFSRHMNRPKKRNLKMHVIECKQTYVHILALSQTTFRCLYTLSLGVQRDYNICRTETLLCHRTHWTTTLPSHWEYLRIYCIFCRLLSKNIIIVYKSSKFPFVSNGREHVGSFQWSCTKLEEGTTESKACSAFARAISLRFLVRMNINSKKIYTHFGISVAGPTMSDLHCNRDMRHQ